MSTAEKNAWEQAQQNFNQTIQSIQELMVQYKAIIKEYETDQLTTVQYYEKFLPVVLLLLENYIVALSYSDAIIQTDTEQIKDLENQVRQYEKFIWKMGLQHKFNAWVDKQRGSKFKNIFGGGSSKGGQD